MWFKSRNADKMSCREYNDTINEAEDKNVWIFWGGGGQQLYTLLNRHQKDTS